MYIWEIFICDMKYLGPIFLFPPWSLSYYAVTTLSFTALQTFVLKYIIYSSKCITHCLKI